MEVDGTFVDGRVRALALDDAEDGAARRLDDSERVGRRAAQAELPGGIVPPCPDVAALRQLQLGQKRSALQGLVSERGAVVVVERCLERGRPDVSVEHARVRVVEDGRLDAPLQQGLRFADEVLVERVLACDEHRQAVAPPPCASPLLAQRRDRAGKADRDRTVQQPDVDAEFECVGGSNAQQLALDESAFDVTTLSGV